MTAAKHGPTKFAGDAYELVERVIEQLNDLLDEYEMIPEKIDPGRLTKPITRLIIAKGHLMTCKRLAEIEKDRAL